VRASGKAPVLGSGRDRPAVDRPAASAGGGSNPVFFTGNVEPRYSEFLTFVGISVDEEGTQLHLDSQIAYRRACLNAIEHLSKFGYSPEQADLLRGRCAVES
jgi:formamidase